MVSTSLIIILIWTENMKENRLPTTGKQKDRANRLVSTIKKLKSLKKSIEKRGEVAPMGCNILKYQIPQNKKIYWYYKLQAACSDF